MPDDLKKEISAIEEEVISLRRDFHQHPELGLKEIRTSRIVADYLEKAGLAVRTGVGQTGVVGLLQGAKPGKTLLMRADMDALPIQEKNQAPYRSENENIINPEPSMGSDDMSRFLEAVPGCYFILGAGNKIKSENYPNHHPLFDIDEADLVIGVDTMVRSALIYLKPDGF